MILSKFTDLVVFAKYGASLDFKNIDVKSVFVYNYVQKDRLLGSLISDAKDIKYTAIHIGTFAQARGSDVFLRALYKLKSRNFKFCVLGTIVEGLESFKEKAIELDVWDMIDYVPHADYNEVFHYLSRSYIGLLIYQPGFMNHVYAFPLKLYEYMIANMPVIAPDFSVEVTPVINELKNGVLIDTSSSTQLCDAITHLVDNKDKMNSIIHNAQQAIISKYNWETQEQVLLKSYKHIVSND